MNKIILDLCGGTGSWSKPYKEAGYDVRVITLPEQEAYPLSNPSLNDIMAKSRNDLRKELIDKLKGEK